MIKKLNNDDPDDEMGIPILFIGYQNLNTKGH